MLKQAALSLAVLAAGCATVTIPPERLESTSASIRGAEELGAQGVPEAKLHLQFAKDQADSARRLAADGDPRATLVMSRAEADAELALGLAREVAVHGDALKAAEDLKAVQARGTP
jgi:non-ribosomal peptide synthetase component F